jgi:hypothetical protein
MRRLARTLFFGACLMSTCTGCIITRGICDCDPSPDGWGAGIFAAHSAAPVADAIKTSAPAPSPEKMPPPADK